MRSNGPTFLPRAVSQFHPRTSPRRHGIATSATSLRLLPGLIAQFKQYLERSDIDLLKDGVGYRQVVLNLSDEELMEMAGAFNAALGRFLAYESKPGRKRRILATVLFPLDDYDDPS